MESLSGGGGLELVRSPRTPAPLQDVERIVGLDLAQTSHHVYAIVDARYRSLGKARKVWDRADSLNEMYERCRSGLPPEAKVGWVMEPTGTAWMRMFAFLSEKGEALIYTPSSRKFSNIRKVINLGVKSDKVDANALARLPAVAGDVLKPLVLPSQELLALKRTVKVLEMITTDTTRAKLRLRVLMDLLNPGALKVLVGERTLTLAARRFVRKAYDPRKVKSRRHLSQLLGPSRGEEEEVEAKTQEELFRICHRNGELVGQWEKAGVLPVHLESLKDELEFLLLHLESLEKRKEPFEKQRDKWVELLDPDKELRSIPGIGPQLSAVILAYTGPIERFENLKSYKGFLGFVAGSNQSGGAKPARGCQITKAGPNPLKWAYYLAGEKARLWDPQMAEFACRLQARGLEYKQIVVAVGNKVAARVYSVLKRRAERDRAESPSSGPKERVHYELRTPENEAITKVEAKALIEQRYRLRTKRNTAPGRAATENSVEQHIGEDAGNTLETEVEKERGSDGRNSFVELTQKVKGPPPEVARQPMAPQRETDPESSLKDIIDRLRCRAEVKEQLWRHRGELGEGIATYLQYEREPDEELIEAQLRVLELRRQKARESP